jgi:hypothetical protein
LFICIENVNLAPLYGTYTSHTAFVDLNKCCIAVVRYMKITFIGYVENKKIGMPNKIKVFVIKSAKGSRQDSQNMLWSHMPEGGEP